MQVLRGVGWISVVAVVGCSARGWLVEKCSTEVQHAENAEIVKASAAPERSAILTINEARAQRGLDPFDDPTADQPAASCATTARPRTSFRKPMAQHSLGSKVFLTMQTFVSC